MDWKDMYNALLDYVGVEEDTLDCCFSLMGCNTETACNLLYYFTGYRNFESFLESFLDEEE